MCVCVLWHKAEEAEQWKGDSSPCASNLAWFIETHPSLPFHLRADTLGLLHWRQPGVHTHTCTVTHAHADTAVCVDTHPDRTVSVESARRGTTWAFCLSKWTPDPETKALSVCMLSGWSRIQHLSGARINPLKETRSSHSAQHHFSHVWIITLLSWAAYLWQEGTNVAHLTAKSNNNRIYMLCSCALRQASTLKKPHLWNVWTTLSETKTKNSARQKTNWRNAIMDKR